MLVSVLLERALVSVVLERVLVLVVSCSVVLVSVVLVRVSVVVVVALGDVVGTYVQAAGHSLIPGSQAHATGHILRMDKCSPTLQRLTPKMACNS